MNMSAALSYYTIFSIGPILVIVIAFAEIFIGKPAIIQYIFGQLEALIGTEGAQMMRGVIERASRPHESFWAALVGILILFFGATGAFVNIQNSLNVIWGNHVNGRTKGWIAVVRKRFLSFGFILSLGFLLLVTLALNAAVAIMSEYFAGYFETVTAVLIRGLDLIISVAIAVIVFCNPLMVSNY